VLGVVWLVGILPFALWLVRPDPERLGWRPDGVRVTPDTVAPPPTGLPFAAAVRTRFFVCATVAYSLILGAQVGGIQQLVKLVEDRTDEGTAAIATTALAGMSVYARLAGGRIVSRVPIVAFTVALAAAQGVALLLIAFATHAATIFPAIILFGATVGNLLMLQPLLIAERFGVLDYARIFSRTQFLCIVGLAGGPLLLGWLFDHAGGYVTPYVVAAACSVLGSLVLAAGGPATVPDP
jgi:MFS family permease